MYEIEKAEPDSLSKVSSFLYTERLRLANQLCVDPEITNKWAEESSSEESLAEQLSYTPSALFTIKEPFSGEDIIATAFINRRPVEDSPELFGLYIRSDHRRKGLGRALTFARLAFLADAGYQQARMWTFRENQPMFGLATSLGFIATDRIYENSSDWWQFTELRVNNISDKLSALV